MADGPRPLVVVTTARYERDSKRVRKRGKDPARLLAVVDALRNRWPRAIGTTPSPGIGKVGGSATSSRTGC